MLSARPPQGATLWIVLLQPLTPPQACGWPCPAAPDAKAGGATNVRAASRVALADTVVSTGGVGLTAGWGCPAVGVFLHKPFAPGAPCFPVPTVAASKHYPHGRCCTIARRSDNLQACVCVASCHHFPCVPAIRLCVARLASTFLALWPSCSACVRACCSALGLPFLAHPFGGWCRHRGFA